MTAIDSRLPGDDLQKEATVATYPPPEGATEGARRATSRQLLRAGYDNVVVVSIAVGIAVIRFNVTESMGGGLNVTKRYLLQVSVVWAVIEQKEYVVSWL